MIILVDLSFSLHTHSLTLTLTPSHLSLQLIELCQRADEYCTRTQRVHFPPYHLSIHHHDNTDQDFSITTSSMTSLPSEEQIPIEVSSPTSNSAEGVHIPRDFDDQRNQHSSQNQVCFDVGRLQDQGKNTHQLFLPKLQLLWRRE